MRRKRPDRANQAADAGRLPGIPEGWVWQAYELPAPNGDGMILLDGWGPPEAAPERVQRPEGPVPDP